MKRRNFQGVLNILSFNRHFYIWGFGVLSLLLVLSIALNWSPIIVTVIVASFVFGLIMPLLVSAYVYDLSGYYRLDWLNTVLPANRVGISMANIHAGFDETSYLLEKKYTGSKLYAFDFYNPEHHTEMAIKRARNVSQVHPSNKVISTNAIPLPDACLDVVFLLSAAHEIRSHQEKIGFLKECRRVCKPQGKVVMVEHLRDLPNFIAFTVGFTHFFSAPTWKNALRSAGFENVQEKKFTPFMSVFSCSSN